MIRIISLPILLIALTLSSNAQQKSTDTEREKVTNTLRQVLNQRKALATFQLSDNDSLLINLTIEKEFIQVRIANLDSSKITFEYPCKQLQIIVEEMVDNIITPLDKPYPCDYLYDSHIIIEPNTGIQTTLYRQDNIRNKVIRIAIKSTSKTIYSEWVKN